ncbi:MAG: Restriction endonuclease [Bacteroidetes bacterium]|nr:MAG: Restriction endonuclease [Bacteroidota bacterium]
MHKPYAIIKIMKGPQFLTYMNPLLDTLKENGGSGNVGDIIDKVIQRLKLTEDAVSKTLPSGGSRVKNRIQWARFYLSKAGLIESGRHGVWQLTKKGFESHMSDDEVYTLFRNVHKQFKQGSSQKSKSKEDKIDDEVVEDEAHAIQLIEILKNLSASGFEKICKRFLTEIGIHDIVITGGSNDQGIDGIGIIKLNDVVNFNIVFQCKRYKDSVAPHHVRDFRGAMQGRADKGLILTTGRFTNESKREASRDGVPPIELIDGERLISLFEKYEIGMKPVTIYEIDSEFFKNFK